VKKDSDNLWRAVNATDEIVEFPTGQVVNIVVPHQGFRENVVYTLTYDALWERVIQMAFSIVASLAAGIVLASIIGIYFATRLVKPLQQLEQGVLRISQGAFGAQIPVETQDEIGVLATNFNQMSKTLKKNTEELLEKQKLTKELEIAREIQNRMLRTNPRIYPSWIFPDHLSGFSGRWRPLRLSGAEVRRSLYLHR
jgi:methyl-accepting chemotaxis protein